VSLEKVAARFPRPIKKFVKRRLSERGIYTIRDTKGLGERGFYDIRGVGEIRTIDEFRKQALAIQRRSRLQTQQEVSALKSKYEQPIFGEIAAEDCLSYRPRSSTPRIS